MRLQLALDFLSHTQAVELIEIVLPYIDIIEAGTPMIIKEGISTVTRMKESFNNKQILADLKIMDAGTEEARIAFEAGADIVTVLGVAYDSTIRSAVEEARLCEKKVMVDMIGVPNIASRTKEVDEIGVDYICMHRAYDIQNEATLQLFHLNTSVSAPANAKLAIAGGINAHNIQEVIAIRPEIIVVGGGITGSEVPQKAAHEIYQQMSRGENN